MAPDLSMNANLEFQLKEQSNWCQGIRTDPPLVIHPWCPALSHKRAHALHPLYYAGLSLYTVIKLLLPILNTSKMGQRSLYTQGHSGHGGPQAYI